MRRLLALAAMLLTACTPAELRAWVAWHEADPDAAVAFATQPDVVADLASGEHEDSDGPQFAQYLEQRGGCDGIYDEFIRQGASTGVAQRFAYRIAPRESGCTPQYVHDRDDWSHSRFGLNGLTAGLRANWQAWCGADVRTDTANLTTDVHCALAAYHRMGWAPWS
jgi:hypothetical protein